MRTWAQVESSPSKDDRSLQQRDAPAHPGTLEPEEAKTIVNPSREHTQSALNFSTVLITVNSQTSTPVLVYRTP